MPFQHSPAGGQGNLVIASLQSPNFVHDVSGWQITKAGNAEFNSGTFRGVIVGGQLFLYNGIAGPGNPPVISLTTAAIDPFGNAVKPDIVAYGTDGTAVQLQPGSSATARFYSGNAAEIEPGLAGVQVVAAGATHYIQTALQSARITGEALGVGAFVQVSSAAFDRSFSPAISLLADDGTFQSFITVASKQIGINGREFIVPPSGDATGATDVATINAVLSNGWAVRLLKGTYWINAPIGPLASGAIIRGAGAGLLETAGTIIQPVAAFAGAAVITWAANTQSQEIRDITFDGSLMPASTCECIGGVAGSHSVLSVKLENLHITGIGFTTGVGNPNGGTTWRGTRVMIHGISGIGFNLSNAPDSTWIDCLSLTAGQYGWRIQGSGNAKFIACRAENSGLHGFYVTGISSVTGGIQFATCSTDGNTNDGVRIDMTGNCPVSFTDLQLREDGKAGAGNFAFNATAAATVPWSIRGLKVFPGTNGGSTGQVPAVGVNIGGAQTIGRISDAMVMATTTPISGMTTANNMGWRQVDTNTGNTTTPGAWTAVADSA